MDDEHTGGLFRRVGRGIWRWNENHPVLVLLIAVPPFVALVLTGLIIGTEMLVPSSVPAWQRGDAFAGAVSTLVVGVLALFYVGKFLWWLRHR